MHDVENNIILLFIFMLCGMFMFARFWHELCKDFNEVSNKSLRATIATAELQQCKNIVRS